MGRLNGTAAVREALEQIDAAFQAAARRRARLVRDLATIAPPDALAGDHRALVEALLRREAADAEAAATPQQRAAAVLAESRRARAAHDRLVAAAGDEAGRAYVHSADVVRREIDATWRWALEQADGAAARLVGRTTTEVSDAVADYVAAFRAVLRGIEALDPDAVKRAVSAADEANARLERLLA